MAFLVLAIVVFASTPVVVAFPTTECSAEGAFRDAGLYLDNNTCPGSRDCSTQLCQRLGLAYSPTSQTGFPCVVDRTFGADACHDLRRSIKDAMQCYSSVAEAQIANPQCLAFARPLYDSLVAAAASDNRSLTKLHRACGEFTCASFSELNLLSACGPGTDLASHCPFPNSAELSFYLIGDSWWEVLGSSHAAFFATLIQNDLAEFLRTPVVDTEILTTAATVLQVNATLPLQQDPDAAYARLTAATAALIFNRTLAEFAKRGGNRATLSFSLSGTTAAPLNIFQELPSNEPVCGTICIVGIVVGVVVLCCVVGALCYCVLRLRQMSLERNSSIKSDSTKSAHTSRPATAKDRESGPGWRGRRSSLEPGGLVGSGHSSFHTRQSSGEAVSVMVPDLGHSGKDSTQSPPPGMAAPPGPLIGSKQFLNPGSSDSGFTSGHHSKSTVYEATNNDTAAPSPRMDEEYV